MLPYFSTYYANPHSNHSFGQQAASPITTARATIAQLIRSHPQDIIFTSGATESNNHAIKGVAALHKGTDKKRIITVQTEHKCVLESCKSLKAQGFDVIFLPVQSSGLVDINELKRSITYSNNKPTNIPGISNGCE
jgi:cysteine desulfurase